MPGVCLCVCYAKEWFVVFQGVLTNNGIHGINNNWMKIYCLHISVLENQLRSSYVKNVRDRCVYAKKNGRQTKSNRTANNTESATGRKKKQKKKRTEQNIDFSFENGVCGAAQENNSSENEIAAATATTKRKMKNVNVLRYRSAKAKLTTEWLMRKLANKNVFKLINMNANWPFVWRVNGFKWAYLRP